MILFLFLAFLALLVAGVVVAGIYAPTKGFSLCALGFVGVAVFFVLIVCLFWKHMVIALAISSVCSLAIGVIFQKVDPSKAIGSALASFILFFIFSWLAIDLGNLLFFNEESSLGNWISTLIQRVRVGYLGSGIGLSLGVAFLITASIVQERWMKALAVFLGTFLILAFGPGLLEYHGVSIRSALNGHDPQALIVIGGIVLCFVAFIKAMVERGYKNAP